MDPISQYLSPFLPLAFLVAAVVAFVRELFTTADPKTKEKKLLIDGKARVLPLVGLISFGVVVWSQYHANPTSPLNWMRVASETPAVFFLAAGGSTFIQRLHDRGRFTLLEEESDDVRDQLGTKVAEMKYLFGEMPLRTVRVSGTVDAPKAEEIPSSEVVVAQHPGSLITGVMGEAKAETTHEIKVDTLLTRDDVVLLDPKAGESVKP